MRFQNSFLRNLPLLSLALIVALSGCRSGLRSGDSVWKRPDLSSLAFWKKEDSGVPKPPAVHFDPTPTQPENRIASNNGAAQNSAVDVQNSLAKLSAAENSPPEAPVDELAKMQENLNSKPIRAPYQVSNQPPALSAASTSVAANPSQQSNTETDFVPLRSPSLTTNSQSRAAANDSADAARSQFNADLQGLLPRTPTAPPNSFAGNNSESNFNQFQSHNNPINQNLNSVASTEQRRLEDEIARAQSEISEFKSQMVGTGNSLKPMGNSLTPMANSSFENHSTFTPQQSDFSLGGSNVAVANVASLDGTSFQPDTSGNGFAPLRPSQPIEPSTGRPSSYPSTNHNGFSSSALESRPSFEGGNPIIRPVGLNEPLNQSVDRNSAPARVVNSVDDVDIPDAILKGKGSFAPGTVNRLRVQ